MPYVELIKSTFNKPIRDSYYFFRIIPLICNTQYIHMQSDYDSIVIINNMNL